MTGVSESTERARSDGGADPSGTIRAAVVEALRGTDEPTTLARLADEIDASALPEDEAAPVVGPGSTSTGRSQSDGGAGSDGRRCVQRLYLALARRHVPLLEARGVVAYDEESGEVRLVASADAADGDAPDAAPSGRRVEEN